MNQNHLDKLQEEISKIRNDVRKMLEELGPSLAIKKELMILIGELEEEKEFYGEVSNKERIVVIKKEGF